MANRALAPLVQLLRQFRLQRGGTTTDAELLELFISQRDEDAFETLVRRHGPMVLGVCRRILHNEADVEDCFQATFLVLVRKATSIRPRGMVGNWLYTVARNAALKARAMRRLRHKKEEEAGAEKMRMAADQDRDLQELLDQELQALPVKYRAAIVLCDLEGMTVPAAAKQVGCPLGTLSARLVRGRVMLGKRLARHGLAVSGGVLATALCQNAASACVPGPLVVSTVQAATLMAAGKALATGAISAKVVALTEGVLKAMLMTKLKIAIAVVMTLNLIGAGVGLVYCQTAGTGQPGKGQPVTAQKQQPTPKADGKDDEKKDGGADPKVAAGAPPAKTDAPKPLPEDIVTAWKEAGAEVGWLRVYPDGFKLDGGEVIWPHVFPGVPIAFGQFVVEKQGAPGDLPAFRFAFWHEGRLAKLPAPASAFGLSLCGTQIFMTDAELELERLQPTRGLRPRLVDRRLTNSVLKELAGLKSLQALDLEGTLVTDAGLKELAGLKSLQALNLRHTQVTHAGLKELAGLKLKTLVLPFTLTDNDLEHYLAAIEPPTRLSLFAQQVTDAGLKELAGLQSLQALDLRFSRVTGAGLKELAGLKNLQALNLASTPVSETGLKGLAGLKNLQTLVLDGAVEDAWLKELAGLKSLQSLNLSTSRVRGTGLKELAGLKSLQTLNLANNLVTDEGLKGLAGLENLQTLDLCQSRVTDAGLKDLAELKSLQTLNLAGCTGVRDAGLKELARLKNLQALNLHFTLVTGVGLKELAGLKSLQTLNLGCCTSVRDAGLKELAGLKSLQALDLYGTQVMDAGLKELAGLTSLQTLSLANNGVTDAGLKELAGLTSLQRLDLSSNRSVTNAGLKELAGLKSLQTLDLGSTQVTDTGLEEMQKALPGCRISR